jgi:membrane-associated protease RseP (regulator of RpoE activity)
MLYQSLYLPLCLRAAIVKGYENSYAVSKITRRPRTISFEAAMSLRAKWVMGADLAALADGYNLRREVAARIVAGLGWTTPESKEAVTFCVVWREFYDALKACEFGPVDAAEGTEMVDPLKGFLQGGWKPKAEGYKDYVAAPAKRSFGRYIGMSVVPISTGVGMCVKRCSKGSPAWDAGVRQGDEVEELNGVAVNSSTDYSGALEGVGPGDVLEVKRKGKPACSIVVGSVRDKGEFKADAVPAVDDDEEDIEPAPAPAKRRSYAGLRVDQDLAITELSKAAWDAGLRVGMQIATVDGAPAGSVAELSSLVDKPAGAVVVLSLVREAGASIDLRLTLAADPPETAEEWPEDEIDELLA